jgi:hypothetical protein
MNNLLLPFLLLFLVACQKEYNEGSLPQVYVETNALVRADEKVSGSLRIELDDQEILESPIGIEYRGSTSFRMSDKKSYGFETRNQHHQSRNLSILGMPAENDWILMGHVYRSLNENDQYAFDPSLMHHYIAYEMARSIGQYASRCQWVELTVNGQYQGVYVLIEKLKADPLRIDIEEAGDAGNALTGGYILKIDKTTDEAPKGQSESYYENNWGDDAKYTSFNSFRSNYDIHGDTLGFEAFRPAYHASQWRETYFLFDTPPPGELNYDQRTYLSSYVHDFEKALLTDDFNTTERTYTDYIDLDSFIDGFFINEIGGNMDAYRISTYLHKPRGGKLRFGPVWDFNIGYGRDGRVPTNDWICNYNNHVSKDAWMVPFWWERFLQDPVFKARAKERWAEFRAGPLSNAAVLALVQGTSDRLNSTGAYARNYDLWRTTNSSIDYQGGVSYLKTYLENRLAWMDGEINQW